MTYLSKPATPIWSWNKLNISQFSLTGSNVSNWTVAYNASAGPNGIPAITFTTTVSAAADLYIYPTVQPTVPDYSIQVYGMGPYTGNATGLTSNTRRVGLNPLVAYTNEGNNYGFTPQGDNVGGAGAINMQSSVRSAFNAGTYTGVGAVWSNTPAPKGIATAKVCLAAANTQADLGVTTPGGRTAFTITGGPTHTGRGMGIRIFHFGASRTINDVGYLYLWELYSDGILW